MIQNSVVRISCPDAKGLVHKITGVFYFNDLNVISNQEFVEPESLHFYMRSEMSGLVDREKIINGLKGILPKEADISLNIKRKKKIVILVTKEHHCVSELLIRNYFGELNAEILAIIGNHDGLKNLCSRFGVSFHYITADNISREQHEQMVISKISDYSPDFIVLAKYMRILTAGFVKHYPNKIINIHHSFLPAFIGANPYKQAYLRGVKIIGATAHFVNDDLDEGPIIKQDVLHVDHTHSWQEMAQAGRDVEKLVLAKALKLVFNDNVFVSGNKTVILE
ncbi:MAG: formyltetrahydrofolate deformylase [Saprospiraceae bacterium]|nr:formyltetrahydrofolate deformylase [Saprospiraceae bacterium]MBL0025356.1 formyltetrahydrofolate deformylase [Saprospiraceae bacterium]